MIENGEPIPPKSPVKIVKKTQKMDKEEDLKYIYYFYRPQLVEGLWKWELEEGDNEPELRKKCT